MSVSRPLVNGRMRSNIHTIQEFRQEGSDDRVFKVSLGMLLTAKETAHMIERQTAETSLQIQNTQDQIASFNLGLKDNRQKLDAVKNSFLRNKKVESYLLKGAFSVAVISVFITSVLTSSCLSFKKT